MAYQRHPQSFRGIVRESLTQIERDLARGFDHPTVLAQLGVPGISRGVFRDALYEARRHARKSNSTAALEHSRLSAQAVPAEKPKPRIPISAQPDAIVNKKPPVHSLRDFLSASKIFKDEELIGRKSA